MENRLPARRLHTSHAFHSSMMDPILREFEDIVSRASSLAGRQAIRFDFDRQLGRRFGNKTGILEPQLRSSVRFADGMAA